MFLVKSREIKRSLIAYREFENHFMEILKCVCYANFQFPEVQL